jgi:predicted nucleic acid-binding protein
MQRVFIDTNILIYYFSKDPVKFSLAEKLLSNNRLRYITSTQVLSEFLSVILRKHITDISQAKQYLTEIISLFEIIPFDIRDMENSLDIKDKYKLSYYDSIIATNALTSDCTILYSEDMHHNLKIEKKLKVVNPFK